MKGKRFWYTGFNILVGGLAFVAAVISYGRALQADSLYFYLIGLVTWILALLLFVSKPDDNFAHLMYLMSVGLMCVCSTDATFSINEQGWQSRFVPFVQFTSSAFLPCLFLRCFATYPSAKRFTKNKFFRLWVYAPGFILSIAMFLSYLSGNEYQKSFFLINISPLLVPNAIFLFGYSIVTHACLLHTWLFGKVVRERKQAKWLFLGISIGALPLTFLNTLPFTFGVELPYGRYSAYTLIMIMICYSIAIMRHKLFDVELILNRSTVYAAVSSVAIVVYLLSSKILGEIFSAISPRSEKALSLFSILIVALLFAPMKQRIQELIDKVFYQRRYSYRLTLLNLSETIGMMFRLRLDELCETLLNQLGEVLQLEFTAILLENNSTYQVYKQTGNEEKLKEAKEALIQIDLKSIKDKPVRTIKGILVIPLLRKEQSIGFILLGKKLSGRNYNAEDISLMKTLSHETSLAIENAMIHERLYERVHFMENAYKKLIEVFSKTHPEILTPKSSLSENNDIISQLEVITEALINSSEKLMELNEIKSQFLSDVSHELRTPLQSIKGFAGNLFDGVVGNIDERQGKYTERILVNCDRLDRMINELLILSRIELGKIELIPTKISLYSLINDVVYEFSPIAKKKSVSLAFDCPFDTIILADGDRLREIIVNLIDNAIKYTHSEGNVSIHVQDKEKQVIISVEDTGIGISPENFEKIFMRFTRIRRKEKGDSNGVGIGLSIVKSLVELHNGKISVQSELDKGSQFVVTIPKFVIMVPTEIMQ
jgi:signal transduction histidine kinase